MKDIPGMFHVHMGNSIPILKQGFIDRIFGRCDLMEGPYSYREGNIPSSYMADTFHYFREII